MADQYTGKQQFVEDLEDLSDSRLEETYATNIFAMFRITRAALKHLPAGSTIINTTSIQAYNSSPTLVDYGTKAAMNAFTKALAQQLAPRGIRVNAVAPGPVWTPLQTAGGQPGDSLEEFGQSTPLGRPAQPAELAPASDPGLRRVELRLRRDPERQRRHADALTPHASITTGMIIGRRR